MRIKFIDLIRSHAEMFRFVEYMVFLYEGLSGEVWWSVERIIEVYTEITLLMGQTIWSHEKVPDSSGSRGKIPHLLGWHLVKLHMLVSAHMSTMMHGRTRLHVEFHIAERTDRRLDIPRKIADIQSSPRNYGSEINGDVWYYVITSTPHLLPQCAAVQLYLELHTHESNKSQFTT